MTSIYLSKAENNFTCFAKTCLDIAKLPLIDLLTNFIKPVDLHNEILHSSTLKLGKNKLRRDQLQICDIPPPNVPDYNAFDVTLLYTLIRNLCPSLKPTKGWGIEPDARDTKIGDDIERLRLLRNNCFAHAYSAKIPDDEFEDLLKNVKSVIQRVQTFTKSWSKIDYEQELAKIEGLRFGYEDLKNCKTFLEVLLILSKVSEDEPKISIIGPEKVLCGDNACFEAEVKPAESSNWSIIWQKVNGNVTQQICTSCELYRICPNKKLLIPSVSPEDEGGYQAVLSRESNDSSHRILSNVIYLQPTGDIPKATISSEQPVYYGSKTILNTQISSCSPPVGVKWQKSTDGNTFSCIDISEPKYYGSSLKPESPLLVITKTTFEDMLYYRLLVWNRIGEEFSNTLSLNVIGRPPDVLTSHEIFIENRSVRLIGKIYVRDQFPQIQTVYWTKNGKRIDAHEEGEKYSEVSIENPSLIIHNVNHHDAGFYRLIAKNAVGSTESEIVLDEPRISFQRTENPDDYQCFTAIIKSTPEAYYAQWKIKGNDSDTFTPIDVNSGEYKGTSSSLPCPVLIVNRKELFDRYCFQIEVNNFVGCCIKDLVISDHESPTIPDKVYRFGGKFLFNICNKNGSTIRFNDLRQRLIYGLKGTVIQELKDSLEVITSERKLARDLNSVSDFFRYLLDEGILTECNVIILQYLMRTINRPDLEELCVQYATKDKKALCYYEDPKNIDKPKVYLHVLADIETFTKMDSLLQTVASIVGCSSTDIEIVGLKPDKSFIITITMRDEFLNILKETNPLDFKILLIYNVDWIKIEDKIVTFDTGFEMLEVIKFNLFLSRLEEMQKIKKATEENLLKTIQKNTSTPLLFPNHVLLSKIKVNDVISPSKNRKEDLLVACNEIVSSLLTLIEPNVFELTRALI